MCATVVSFVWIFTLKTLLDCPSEEEAVIPRERETGPPDESTLPALLLYGLGRVSAPDKSRVGYVLLGFQEAGV